MGNLLQRGGGQGKFMRAETPPPGRGGGLQYSTVQYMRHLRYIRHRGIKVADNFLYSTYILVECGVTNLADLVSYCTYVRAVPVPALSATPEVAETPFANR